MKVMGREKYKRDVGIAQRILDGQTYLEAIKPTNLRSEYSARSSLTSAICESFRILDYNYTDWKFPDGTEYWDISRKKILKNKTFLLDLLKRGLDREAETEDYVVECKHRISASSFEEAAERAYRNQKKTSYEHFYVTHTKFKETKSIFVDEKKMIVG